MCVCCALFCKNLLTLLSCLISCVVSFGCSIASCILCLVSISILIRIFGFRLIDCVCADFLVIPILFYIIVAATQADLGALRKSGWVFDMGDAEAEAWYEFYSYFGALCLFSLVTPASFYLEANAWCTELGRVQFGPLWSTLPTQFALCVLSSFERMLSLTRIRLDCFSTFYIHRSTCLLYVSLSNRPHAPSKPNVFSAHRSCFFERGRRY